MALAGDITITVDDQGYRNALGGLYDALNARGEGDAEQLLRTEARMLAMTITNFTPPLGKGTAPKAVGEKAVERGITSLFSEFQPGFIDDVGSEHGIQSVDAWRMIGGTPVHLIWQNVDPVGTHMKAYHDEYRTKNGVIDEKRTSAWKKGAPNEWKAIVVEPVGARGDYLREVQKRVGRWKATWGQAVVALGGHVPAWISRHFGNVFGSSVDVGGLNQATAKEVSFTSRCYGNDRTQIQQSVRDAVRKRSRTLARRTQLVLSGYSKDVANHIRPRKHANNVPTEPVPEVQ